MKTKGGPALKVGVLVVIFVILLYISLAHMGVFQKKVEGKEYIIQFDRVGGLSGQAPVRYAGVTVGKVKTIEIDKDNKVNVRINIYKYDAFETGKIELTRESTYTVASSFMGDKWIEILPRPGTPLNPGEVVEGIAPGSLGEILTEGQATLKDAKETLANFNKLLGDEQMQKDIKDSLKNVKEMTSELKETSKTANNTMKNFSGKIDTITDKLSMVMDNANMVMENANYQLSRTGENVGSLTHRLDRLVATNEGDVRVIVQNLVKTSESVNNTVKVIEELVEKKEFSEDILQTLKNVRNATEEIEGIAADIHAITADQQFKDDIKLAVSNARQASERANNLLKTVNGYMGVEGEGGEGGDPKKSNKQGLRKLIEVNAELEWDKKTGEVSPNINAYLLPYNRSSLKIGVDSLGYDNYWNLQYRMGTGSIQPRIGVVRSKLGIGLDANLGKSADIFVDAYDPRDMQVDVTGRVIFARDFYLHGGVRDVFDRKKPVFGVGKRF